MNSDDLRHKSEEWERAGIESELGLWWLVSDIKELLATANKEEILAVTLDLLKPLLVGRKLIPVEFNEKGEYTLWNDEPEAAFRKIRDQLSELGRLPDIGDICMFIAPGHDLVKSHLNTQVKSSKA